MAWARSNVGPIPSASYTDCLNTQYDCKGESKIKGPGTVARQAIVCTSVFAAPPNSNSAVKKAKSFIHNHVSRAAYTLDCDEARYSPKYFLQANCNWSSAHATHRAIVDVYA